jgi:hypothetical protein
MGGHRPNFRAWLRNARLGGTGLLTPSTPENDGCTRAGPLAG